MQETPGSSAGAGQRPDALLGRILGLPEPHRRDWLDYEALGLTSEHEPALLHIATDPALLDADEAPEYWAPVHAVRSLGALRSKRAVAPLLEALDAGGMSDDWFMSDLPEVFGAIGPAAVAPLVAFGADPARDLYARMTTVDALGHIGRRHEAALGACIDGLTAILEEFERQDPSFNAMVIGSLVELGARDAAPLIRAAFAADHVDLRHMGDWEDVEIELGLRTERSRPRAVPLEGRDGPDASGAEPLGGWRDLEASMAEALGRLLSRPGRSSGPTSPRELEGFLFAVACAPEVVRPSEWLEVLLGEGPPFEDEAEAHEALDAVVTLYGIVQDGVNRPVFDAPEGLFRDDLMANLEEDAEVAQWSRGFIQGHSWLEEAWEGSGELEALVDEHLGSLLFALSFFASRSLAERYQKELAGEKMSLDEMGEFIRGSWSGALVDYATLGRTLLAAQVNETKEAPARLRPATAEPRSRRNDPCPCGSGRKYKRCCGRGAG